MPQIVEATTAALLMVLVIFVATSADLKPPCCEEKEDDVPKSGGWDDGDIVGSVIFVLLRGLLKLARPGSSQTILPRFSPLGRQFGPDSGFSEVTGGTPEIGIKNQTSCLHCRYQCWASTGFEGKDGQQQQRKESC